MLGNLIKYCELIGTRRFLSFSLKQMTNYYNKYSQLKELAISVKIVQLPLNHRPNEEFLLNHWQDDQM